MSVLDPDDLNKMVSRGLKPLYVKKLEPWCDVVHEIALWRHAGSLLRHGFRNRLKCHLLQSIILSLSLIAVNVLDYHFHLLQ